MKKIYLAGVRLLVGLISVALAVAVVAGLWFFLQLRSSRPLLAGESQVRGLSGSVTIERDNLGVPTIRGAGRVDVARALGWVHAQERFFQMDLLRRRAAGELAELVGEAALDMDKATRIHGFRGVARAAMERASPAERELADAYTAGVNAGLTALANKPFEYVLLRATPQPWRTEDCGLVGFSMTLDMQSGVVEHERMIAALRNALGAEVFAFFAPLVGPRDAAIDGTTSPLAKIPSARAINLRKTADDGVGKITSRVADHTEAEHRGSNAFALSGAHTASGVGMLANDMHLSLGLPNTWYRVSLVWPDSRQERRVTGVTFPGVPFVVAGSNGHVAWGFTNSPTDASDLIVVQTGISPEVYRAPNVDPMPRIEVRKETIAVSRSAPVAVEYRWTIWGPIVGEDDKGRPLARRWTAHDPEAQNLTLWQMETAETTAAAVAIAHRAGVTPLNFHVVDTAGEIAWTIAGRLPKRVGYDGRWPVTWTFGDRRWDGLIAPDDMPTVRAPASGRSWTANARVLGGADGAMLGDAGFAEPMRAAQIRDALEQLERAEPKDLLAIQLDDRALALGRWRELLLAALDPASVAGNSGRSELRTQVENWNARATVDSVGYRLVRAWRDAVAKRVLDPIFAACLDEDRGFRWTRLNYEEPLWALLNERPMHLLGRKESSWEMMMVSAVDDVLAELDKSGTPVANATWGRRNVVRIQHPLARVLPGFLTTWMNLPDMSLPGDSHMPRMQTPRLGASERFVVSPGREAEGIFHMPGGQSGHPLSPFYRAGHEAWVRGDPSPFLPGKTEHVLTLRP